MKRLFDCNGVGNMKERGVYLKPDDKWDDTLNYQFHLRGKSDLEYAKDETWKSVNGWAVWLNSAPISYQSKMMLIIALSATEAELFAATQCAMDMLFAMRVMNAIGLKIQLPMILEVDNKVAVDLCNNWSIGGRTRHVEVKQFFLRELKESGLIHEKWTSGDAMTSDMFTKNLAGPLISGWLNTVMSSGLRLQQSQKGECQSIWDWAHGVACK